MAGLLAAVLLYMLNPSKSGLFPPCPFHALTGWYCPGCGSLRAIHQLLHGDILAALQFNPLMVLSLPFVIYGLAAEMLKTCLNVRLPVVCLRAYWIWAIFAVIVLYGIGRNIPYWPFILLAP
jgi:hypothetical protein